MNSEELEFVSKLVNKVGTKSEEPKGIWNNLKERIIRLEQDQEGIEEMVEKYNTTQNSINRELKHAIANVPKIKPVDTFTNSDDHREMVRLLKDLKTTLYRHSDQISAIEEWITADGFAEKAKIRNEIATDDKNKDKDLREVSLEDIIKEPDYEVPSDVQYVDPLVPHLDPDWATKLVNEEIKLDTRTQNLMRNLNIVTLEELMCFTQKELMSENNFGGCSMAKLNNDLKKLGLSMEKGD